MLVYPQTIEFSRNCHRQIGLFLLVEALAPSPSEHESVLGNAYCGYAILPIAGLHNLSMVLALLLLGRTFILVQKAIHISLYGKEILHLCLQFTIFLIDIFLLGQQPRIFGLQGFYCRQLLNAKRIKMLFSRLMHKNIRLMILLEFL